MSRILIVEDERHLADGLRFNLEAEGFEVVVTDTAEVAHQMLLADKQVFDAIVLDVMLPGKNGFTLATELRAAGCYTPILMLTARNRAETRIPTPPARRGRRRDRRKRRWRQREPAPAP